MTVTTGAFQADRPTHVPLPLLPSSYLVRESGNLAGPGMTRGVGHVPPGALVRSLLAIARGELDFKLVDLVPLGFGSLALRYREQLLQALTRGNGLLRRVHGGIIAHVPEPRDPPTDSL